MAIKDNKIYVADYGKKCLVEFDIEKGTSRDIGERGSIPNVVVMAIKDNKIYVADYGKKCLVEFDIEKGTFKDIGERGSIPDAVAMTINGGKIYVADCSKKCLVEFDIEKGTSKDIGERGSINASAMAIKDNKIYVADYGKKCLVEFDIEKGTSKDIGERGSMPDAVAMAIKDNKIYVADRSKKCLVEFNIPEPAGVNTRPTDPVGSTTSANPPKDMTKPAAETDTVELKGTVISAGSATGNARKAKADTFESLKERAGKTPRDLTIDDVNKAIRDVIADLNGIISRSGRGSRAAQIIEPFRSLCDDSAFIEKIDGYIKGGMNAAEAVIKAGKEEAGKLRALKDAYLQQRALSFTDAYLRIVRKLLNEDRQEAIHGPDIVVTNVLYPTDIVDRYTGAKAIIVTDSDVGDRSDAALIAKSLNIPVIVVNDDRMRSIPNGTEITVDADNGTVSFEGATQPTRLTDPVGLIVPTAAVGTVLTREVTWAEKLANTIKISAAEADTENHRIIIGLQTDEWVPGEQASDIQALERAVKRFADTLKRRGVMQNVSIVLGSSKNLAANIASEKPASGDKVVILGSEKTLAQDEFKSFKDAYFAYVDLSKLKSLDYISLIEMIDMAVHFAVDNAAASNSGIQVETLGERIVRFTPSRRLDVEEPSKVYKLQIRELAKQA
jgi:phosphohistidine swiveling domain-containing protein